MRPISKGEAPRIYRKYSNAQPDLIQRLGRFCSYCERKIPSSIAVEHKQPKKKYPGEELNWDNFLLSCSNCNSSKRDRKINLSRYFWPDSDNTFRAFEYTAGGIVRSCRTIPTKLRRRANRTIHLLGLDKHPGNHRRPTDRDYRWQDRRNEWDKAVTMREQLGEYDTSRQREAIVKSAQDGLFSIWMQVFEDDLDMRKRFIQAFPGTASDCFDVNCKAITRPGGQI